MTDAALLLRGGVVYSPADPFATAMVVADGRVAWVGSEGAADATAGPGLRTVDLRGGLVTPAFVDAHVHLTDTGLALSGLDLTATVSAHDVLERVSAAVRARPGQPVLGHGWDDTVWSTSPPSREEIDRAAEGAPVYLSRVDVHSALLSTAMLERVPGIAAMDGFDSSGPLSRQAHHRVRRASRDSLTAAERQGLQHTALRAAAAAGIGQVHEMAAPHIAGAEDLTLLRAWTADRQDVPEVVSYWGELNGVDTARELGARGCAGDLCIDGSVGSRTAAMSRPYAGGAGRGAQYVSLDEATAHVVACTRAGMQAGFHCIGDAAVATAVDALRAAAERCGQGEVMACRHRLEHVEMVDAEQARVMAALGVVASVQPAFDASWGGSDGMYARSVGASRAETMNPFAMLARTGVTLAFGSDSPVTPFDPWGSVRAAAEHRTPDHRLTARAAFAAHTRGGWRAAGLDGAGVLVPGAPASYAVWDVDADLVVQAPDGRVAAWSTDPRAGVPGLPDMRASAPVPTCRQTTVRGRVVHDADTPGS